MPEYILAELGRPKSTALEPRPFLGEFRDVTHGWPTTLISPLSIASALFRWVLRPRAHIRSATSAICQRSIPSQQPDRRPAKNRTVIKAWVASMWEHAGVVVPRLKQTNMRCSNDGTGRNLYVFVVQNVCSTPVVVGDEGGAPVGCWCRSPGRCASRMSWLRRQDAQPSRSVPGTQKRTEAKPNALRHVMGVLPPEPRSDFAMWDFYESQLAILAFFSIFFYGLDKRFSRKSNPKERSDNLENGRLGHSDNVSVLARKYLTVYAIVMGETKTVNNLSLSDRYPQPRTGSKAHTCTPCTAKSMHFQNEWLPCFL